MGARIQLFWLLLALNSSSCELGTDPDLCKVTQAAALIPRGQAAVWGGEGN
jgi:hypothetical protein